MQMKCSWSNAKGIRKSWLRFVTLEIPEKSRKNNEWIHTCKYSSQLFIYYSLQLIYIHKRNIPIEEYSSFDVSIVCKLFRIFLFFNVFFYFWLLRNAAKTELTKRQKQKPTKKKQISNQMQMIWRQVKSTENDSRQRVFCADPLGTLAMLMVCINPAAYHAQRYGLMMSPLDKCENAKARRCVQSKALTAQCRSMEFDGWLNGKGFLHSCVSLEASCKELLLVVTSGWAKCKYPAVLSNSSEYFHEWIDFFIYLFLCGRPLCKSI